MDLLLWCISGCLGNHGVAVTPNQSPVDNSLLQSSARCQEITIPMCKSIRYNFTEMPNPFNHETQDEAGLEVHQYWPLVEIKCSDDLKFFICSLYVPICMEDYVGTVPACRSVCERARQVRLSWPDRMGCEQFPKYGKHSICMDEKNGELPGTNAIIPKLDRAGVFTSGILKKKCDSNACACRNPLVTLNPNSYVHQQTGFFQNTSSTISTGSCALRFPAGATVREPEEIRFANYWLTFWSAVTCGLSTITILTFMIDTTRFNYPERPIICISFCYVFVSLGYLTRIYVGHAETACGGGPVPPRSDPAVPKLQPGLHGGVPAHLLLHDKLFHLVRDPHDHVVPRLRPQVEHGGHLREIRSLPTPRRRCRRAIITYDYTCFPGDSISGICFVGNQEYWNLVFYVLVPMGGMLLLGTFFLVSGFIALMRIRSVIVREVRNVHKLEKLMIRIGVFSVLYTVNVVAVLSAYVYEAYVREEWVNKLNCNDCNDVVVENGNFKPAYSVLMIKWVLHVVGDRHNVEHLGVFNENDRDLEEIRVLKVPLHVFPQRLLQLLVLGHLSTHLHPHQS
ncbi:Frizzled-8 [Orchesella cincta]|uniref:Frizzled-8 n=1 Tax=Orchesella cincta TaxID=48709 RepID=A0A1D2ME67_ORCCI|nr:Frizzled-8 [Orchesella cincta]